MDDREIKKLRQEQVEWAKMLGEIEETKDVGETLLLARPNSIVLKALLGMANWLHRKVVKGDEIARREARKTYDQ